LIRDLMRRETISGETTAMPLKTYQDQLPELNLTSMIDVVFLLIIFFMAGTKFAEMERAVKLEVPRVENGGTLTSSKVRRVVNIYRDGSILLDQRTLTVDALEAELRATATASPDVEVVVRGDAEGPFQNVATVLTACRTAGVRDLGISVQLSKRE
jgi:biopolymer transport protein ExbD